jgi:hypothetical protein
LILPDEGYYLAFNTTGNPTLPIQGGSAGYDPSLTSMLGLFSARGPAFKKGLDVPSLEVQAVDIYPLMARVLDMEKLPTHRGSLDAMSQAGIFA